MHRCFLDTEGELTISLGLAILSFIIDTKETLGFFYISSQTPQILCSSITDSSKVLSGLPSVTAENI